MEWQYTPMPLIKYCFVPSCKNNSDINPEKMFFCVPSGNKEEWCRAAGKTKTPKSRVLFVCDDHLNLEEDMENYMYWKIMKHTGNVRARLKPHPPVLKNISPALLNVAETSVSSQAEELITVPKVISQGIICVPEVACKNTQVTIKRKDQTTQCSMKIQSTVAKKNKMISIPEDSTASLLGSTTEMTEFDSTSEISSPGFEEKTLVGRQFLMGIVKNKPLTYIGLPEQYLWIVSYLATYNKLVNELSITTTLYKIRNGDTLAKISDLFQISLTTVWRNFHYTIGMLNAFFKQFIYWPSALDIKKNLPNAFQKNKEYANIQAIIDCFEIEIEKPANPVNQSLTWSQYKSCNTMKYLISATPNGFINYISRGYGGRISDIRIVEECGFLKVIPENCTILSDRGFKNLEKYLNKQRVKLLRPPSVYANKKPSKEEVMATKVIASLRVHIERVIRRVRMYKLLKPHSTVNNKLVNVLDDAVTIACALVNLQSPIIKNI